MTEQSAAVGAILKVCGLVRAEDVATCVRLGADAVGLNLWEGSPRGRTVATHRRILQEAGPLGGTRKVGVFVHPSRELVRRARAELGLDLVQYHTDRLPPFFAEEGSYVWVLRGPPDPASLVVPDPPPAWVLVDARVPGYGGAGRTADWSAAAAVVRRLSPLPVLLAGGIGPENASQALREVGAAGLDVASGAERPGAPAGVKDPDRIAALVRACKSAPGVATRSS